MACKSFKMLGIISAFLLCTQFSSQKSSTDGREKPSTNVYGLLTDSTNHSYYVENITIGGRFNQIAVYQKPSTNNPDVNPDINTTRIDLCEVSEIKIECPRVVQFNKREYIEIVIISNDMRKTKNYYIIEKLKKLFCDEINEAGPIEKELSFLAVQRIQIQGCKNQEDEPRRSYKSCPCNAADQKAIDLTITKTQSLLRELENTAAKISNDQEDGTVKSQILQILNDLKETFQNWFA